MFLIKRRSREIPLEISSSFKFNGEEILIFHHYQRSNSNRRQPHALPLFAITCRHVHTLGRSLKMYQILKKKNSGVATLSEGGNSESSETLIPVSKVQLWDKKGFASKSFHRNNMQHYDERLTMTSEFLIVINYAITGIIILIQFWRKKVRERFSCAFMSEPFPSSF